MHLPYSERLATDLWEAVDAGDVHKVQSLLEQGADPNHQLYWSEEWIRREKNSGLWYKTLPPLGAACYKGNLRIVKLLVQRGCDVDKSDGKHKETSLHTACYAGHKHVVEYLITEAKCKVGELLCILYIYSLNRVFA